FASRRRHTRFSRDWSSDVCSSDLDEGWDRLREERLARLVASGLLDPSWRLTDRDPTQPPWTDAAEKAWLLRCMEVYAAQIDRMRSEERRVGKARRHGGTRSQDTTA